MFMASTFDRQYPSHSCTKQIDLFDIYDYRFFIRKSRENQRFFTFFFSIVHWL